MKYYVALDGGGTKTDGILADGEGNILARLGCSGCNPNDIGEKAAAERIISLARALSAKAPGEVSTIFAGISGAGNHHATLNKALSDAFPSAVCGVGTDAENLLCSELPEGDGCCLICGTGSVCFARCGGEYHRIGGWGWLLDGGGSGYDIGRDALSAALRAHDSRGNATMLTETLTDKLGGCPWDRLTDIYNGGKPFIASLAPCVFKAADSGDSTAKEILYNNMNYLSEYLSAAYKIIGKPFPAVLGGGIFTGNPESVSVLRELLTVPATLVPASREQVFGALEQAFRM